MTFPPSFVTWALDRLEQPSSEKTQMETTNPEIAGGQQEKSNHEIERTAFEFYGKEKNACCGSWPINTICPSR
jgi:hypothetical protein